MKPRDMLSTSGRRNFLKRAGLSLAGMTALFGVTIFAWEQGGDVTPQSGFVFFNDNELQLIQWLIPGIVWDFKYTDSGDANNRPIVQSLDQHMIKLDEGMQSDVHLLLRILSSQFIQFFLGLDKSNFVELNKHKTSQFLDQLRHHRLKELRAAYKLLIGMTNIHYYTLKKNWPENYIGLPDAYTLFLNKKKSI